MRCNNSHSIRHFLSIVFKEVKTINICLEFEKKIMFDDILPSSITQSTKMLRQAENKSVQMKIFKIFSLLQEFCVTNEI